MTNRAENPFQYRLKKLNGGRRLLMLRFAFLFTRTRVRMISEEHPSMGEVSQLIIAFGHR